MSKELVIARAPMLDGVKTGVDRFLAELPHFQGRDAALARATSLVETALESLDHGLSDRGTKTFAELTALAVCARDHFGHEALDDKHAAVFLGWLEKFLNSWMHE